MSAYASISTCVCSYDFIFWWGRKHSLLAFTCIDSCDWHTWLHKQCVCLCVWCLYDFIFWWGRKHSLSKFVSQLTLNTAVWPSGIFSIDSPSVQFSSVPQSCPTLCDPMNRSTPGLPVHSQIPESTQTHVHRVGDAIQPSHPLSFPSPPVPYPSRHQGLFQWVNSSHEVAKVLEFQPQHQSFQWTPRTDLL